MKEALSEALTKKVLELLQGREKVKNLRIGSVVTDDIPSTGKLLYKIDSFKIGDPNGKRHEIVTDEDGNKVDLKALSGREGKTFFAEKTLVLGRLPVASPASSITIDPTENNLVLNPGIWWMKPSR
jgi:hypothetical protein